MEGEYDGTTDGDGDGDMGDNCVPVVGAALGGTDDVEEGGCCAGVDDGVYDAALTLSSDIITAANLP